MWGLVIAAFLVGAATGGFWSRRRAVSQAFQSGHAIGEASAMAFAQGGSVIFNGTTADVAAAIDSATDHGAIANACTDDYYRAMGRALRGRPDDMARLDAARLGALDVGDLRLPRPSVDVGSNGIVN
jgi:hypothetical protein